VSGVAARVARPRGGGPASSGAGSGALTATAFGAGAPVPASCGVGAGGGCVVLGAGAGWVVLGVGAGGGCVALGAGGFAAAGRASHDADEPTTRKTTRSRETRGGIPGGPHHIRDARRREGSTRVDRAALWPRAQGFALRLRAAPE
jgi:hypothetical protein